MSHLPSPPPSAQQPQQLLIRQLQNKIRRVETSCRNDDGTLVSSGSSAIDQLLPAGGYQRGTIIEWLAERGCSTAFLSLLVARQAMEDGGALVVIDQQREFYPPAARALGIRLNQVIVLRGGSDRHYRFHHQTTSSPPLVEEDFYWAIDQALRCNAVAAVWGTVPDFATPQIGERWLRRFQLSAEASGCLGLFTRPPSSASCASWSEIQWQLHPLRSQGHARRIRATLHRCRGGTAGRTIDLELNTITGNVQQVHSEQHAKRLPPKTLPLPLAASMAHSTIGRRRRRS